MEAFLWTEPFFFLLCTNCKGLNPSHKSGSVLCVVGMHLQACSGYTSACSPFKYLLCTVQLCCVAPVNMFSGFNVDRALINQHLRHGSKTPGLFKVSWHVFSFEGGKRKERARLRSHQIGHCDENAMFPMRPPARTAAMVVDASGDDFCRRLQCFFVMCSIVFLTSKH